MLFVLVKRVAVSVMERQEDACMLFSSQVKGGNYLYLVWLPAGLVFGLFLLLWKCHFRFLDSSHFFFQEKDKNKRKENKTKPHPGKVELGAESRQKEVFPVLEAIAQQLDPLISEHVSRMGFFYQLHLFPSLSPLSSSITYKCLIANSYEVR